MKDDQLGTYLLYLKLSYFQEHHQSLAQEAAEKMIAEIKTPNRPGGERPPGRSDAV